jgi:hypothetical protein
MPMTSSAASISLRRATLADERAVAYLAQLDDAERLTGDVLVAYDGDRAVAAMSMADGRTVADPFTRTAHVVALLRLRAQQQRSRPARRFGFGLRRLGVV